FPALVFPVSVFPVSIFPGFVFPVFPCSDSVFGGAGALLGPSGDVSVLDAAVAAGPGPETVGRPCPLSGREITTCPPLRVLGVGWLPRPDAGAVEPRSARGRATTPPGLVGPDEAGATA